MRTGTTIKRSCTKGYLNYKKEIGMRSHRQDVTLDSYIISATPYEDLHQKYDDGSWNIERFADAHILFFEQE